MKINIGDVYQAKDMTGTHPYFWMCTSINRSSKNPNELVYQGIVSIRPSDEKCINYIPFEAQVFKHVDETSKELKSLDCIRFFMSPYSFITFDKLVWSEPYGFIHEYAVPEIFEAINRYMYNSRHDYDATDEYYLHPATKVDQYVRGAVYSLAIKQSDEDLREIKKFIFTGYDLHQDYKSIFESMHGFVVNDDGICEMEIFDPFDIKHAELIGKLGYDKFAYLERAKESNNSLVRIDPARDINGADVNLFCLARGPLFAEKNHKTS